MPIVSHSIYRGVFLSYRIEYAENAKRKPIDLVSPKKKKQLFSLLFVAITAVIFILLSQSEFVCRFVLPGDPLITEQALTSLTDNIRSGRPLGEAAFAFCQEIIAGAEIQ